MELVWNESMKVLKVLLIIKVLKNNESIVDN